jgi:hypothetical protein
MSIATSNALFLPHAPVCPVVAGFDAAISRPYFPPETKWFSCATATCLLMAIPHFPYSKVSTKISRSSQNIWGSIKVTSGEMRCVVFITIRLPGVCATDIAHNRCCSGVAQVFQVERHQSIAAGRQSPPGRIL